MGLGVSEKEAGVFCKRVQTAPFERDTSQGLLLVPLRTNYVAESWWNRILAGLETSLTFLLICKPEVDVPTDENRLSHNALTRRIDPRHPEGPWIFF